MSEYKAEGCPCGDPTTCEASLDDYTPAEVSLIRRSCITDITRAGTDLRSVGISSDEIRQSFVDDAAKRAQPLEPGDFDQVRRTVAALRVVIEGMEAALALDIAMLNAQRAISSEVH